MDTISLSSEWDAPQHWQWKGYSISQYLRAACGRVIRFEHWAFFNSSIIANNYIFCIFLPSFCYWLREWIHIGLYYQAQGQCTCGKKCIWKFGHNAWALEWSRSRYPSPSSNHIWARFSQQRLRIVQLKFLGDLHLNVSIPFVFRAKFAIRKLPSKSFVPVCKATIF